MLNLLWKALRVNYLFKDFNYVESEPEEAKHWFIRTQPRPLTQSLIDKGMHSSHPDKRPLVEYHLIDLTYSVMDLN